MENRVERSKMLNKNLFGDKGKEIINSNFVPFNLINSMKPKVE
jgi:hypothetical protein